MFHCAIETHGWLAEAYGDYTYVEKTCKELFQRFQTGDFDVNDKAHGISSKKNHDDELQELLNEHDAQTQQQSPNSSIAT